MMRRRNSNHKHTFVPTSARDAGRPRGPAAAGARQGPHLRAAARLPRQREPPRRGEARRSASPHQGPPRNAWRNGPWSPRTGPQRARAPQE
eukprot:8923836-Pyramimonas_sp.AAC.1